MKSKEIEELNKQFTEETGIESTTEEFDVQGHGIIVTPSWNYVEWLRSKINQPQQKEE